MISSNSTVLVGQGSDGCPQLTYFMKNGNHDSFIGAIQSQAMISLRYQKNPRTIIPLVYGKLKNGKNAVLCYKVYQNDDSNPEIALRLYHCEKISRVRVIGDSLPVNRKIDYYLTKHFGTVYQKC